MKLRHSKNSSDDIESGTESSAISSADTGGTDNNWKCPSCGAMNEDFRKFCDGCGDKRPGAAVQTKGISMDELLGSGATADDSTPTEDTGKKAKGKKEKKSKKSKKSDDDDETNEPQRLQPVSSEPEPFQPATTAPTDDFESKNTGDFGSKPSDDFGSKPSFVLTGPEPTPTNDTTSPNDSFSSFEPSSATTTLPSPSSGSGFPSGQRYYLVFVNTPASSLIKTKVAIEFDDFPTVTIGRSPENVIVIPDPEVSRKHASLTFDGGRLTLKDLGSSNGSFIYNGKDFQRVSDSVEVRPNSVIKFGTGTIVKLVTE